MAKIIVVFGATGKQGGSVSRALLKLPGNYHVRAVTRDTSKPQAQALAKLGAELTRADLRDPRTIQEALKGAYGVFAVTDYWAQPPTKWGENDEAELGIALAEAAKAAGVNHFVWSTLPSANAISNGKYDKVEHWETKACVTKYIQEQLPDLPTTYIYLGAYFDSFASFASEAENGDITIAFPLPTNSAMPMVWASKDTGPVVTSIFEKFPETVGKTYGIHRLIKFTDAVTIFEKVTGSKTTYVPIDREQFLRNLGGGVVAHDVLGYLEFFAEYEGFGKYEVTEENGVLLGNKISKLEDWVKSSTEEGEKPWTLPVLHNALKRPGAPAE